MGLLLTILLLVTNLAFGEFNITNKVTQIISELKPDVEGSSASQDKNSSSDKSREIYSKRQRYLTQLEEIDRYLNENNIWSKVYSNYEAYKHLEFMATELKKRIEYLESRKRRRRRLTQKEEKALKKYREDFKINEGKLAQLKEYRENPFKELLKPDDIGDVPLVRSPLDIIKAISFKKHIKSVGEDYNGRFISLKDTVKRLESKRDTLSEFIRYNRDLNITEDSYIDELQKTEKQLKVYRRTLEIFKTSKSALDRKISELNLNIKADISKQIEKAIIIASTILFLLLGFLLIKFLVRKYMSENELFYTTNKALNFTFITIVAIILLFSYLENVSHLVTILSFASAGIAIALKDWFMNIMGWMVIIFSGSLHVGDRVKFLKDGKEYVGDIVDISILRMTIHEDVTLTTYEVNRRAGRIIFVPNNYIFTEMIANYSHAGIKTVWDGIDFVITFDSNISKAQSISKEIVRKYSKGYTDMTRKQLNRLRSKYNMRNTAVEPRVFAFFDTYGVRISVWYLTNAFATLTLRSTISMEILNRIREEDDIDISIPAQSIYVNRPSPTVRED